MKKALALSLATIIVLFSVLALTGYGLFFVWAKFAVPMILWMWQALIAGTIFSILLSFVLNMILVFVIFAISAVYLMCCLFFVCMVSPYVKCCLTTI